MSNLYLQETKPAGLWPRLHSISPQAVIHKPFFFRLLCLTWFAAGAAFTSAQSLSTEQAAPAQALVDTAGVNTHLTYTNTSYYTAWPQIFNRIQSE